MKTKNIFALTLALTMLISMLGVFPVGAQTGSVDTRLIPSAGTSSPQTGEYTPSGASDQTQAEFPGQLDEEDGSPGPYPGTIVNRSLSNGTGNGVSINSGKKAKSQPQFSVGFEGLNLYQQRYARGGNQFTVEPPDQALCAGGGYVVEAVNDVLNVFDTNGNSLLPDNTATNIVSGWLDFRNCLDKSCPTLKFDDIFVTRNPELTDMMTEGIWLTSPSPIDKME